MSRDFNLGGTIPSWGRGASEYEAFFALGDVPASARILDCGGGPASFTAEWSRQGRFVVASDPVYGTSADDIATTFELTATRMLEGMRRGHHRFLWDHYKTPEAVVERRRRALKAFIADFGSSTPAGRYVAARLPELPFESKSFDVVLCSHLLFLYSAELDLQTHIASMRGMIRVGREVRIFPLLDMDSQPSAHLNASVAALRSSARVELVPVPFEFRPGDSAMLRLTDS
jgi:hypothetical protein